MERQAGTVYVRVGNTALAVAGSCKIGIKPKERATLSGLSGPAGYSEKLLPSFIEVEVYDTANTDLEALHDAKNVDVQAELANGKTAILNRATQMTAAESDGGEGTSMLRFEAKHEDGKWA